MKILALNIAIFTLIILRLPWTIVRLIRAYHYAMYIDRRVTHNGDVTLSLESGERISYKRGKGLNLIKFIGAFRDRR